ncbi:hypothetical protein SCHPADRAFT_831992 [Schizopora paradoxa]|uniref:CCDC174 alpha/beta GRSR domain-containing protein n=1 Tax=Schizopora paradoxa TaxID=27342 RepID=A0A0H2RG59_9AGAM|nr:hypothetical protein SCHPADRAFT_831992 [Schizopora paradoxa]
MPPSKKAKASGVSASSFLDLKSELAKKETEFAKRKAAGKTFEVGSSRGSIEGDSGRVSGTVWARSNKGVDARRARDIEALRADRSTAESAREALERKAKIYEKLKKGKSGGLTDAQYDGLLVDFDSKAMDEHYSSDSEDVDESLTVPKPPDDDDDPIVEYEDEFGRTRTSRRSEVPRNLMPSADAEQEEEEELDPFVLHNPVNHFPIYEPSSERVAAINEAAKETAAETHYDAAKEVRAKGAAFYAFSADEEKRRKEMEALRAARDETEQTRKETGAVDAKVGEVEGMVAPGEDSSSGSRSRAAEKRRREIEERRRLVDAKRRKVKEERENEPTEPIAQKSSNPEQVREEIKVKADASDPFAALEAQSHHQKERHRSSKKKGRESGPPVDADDFLAQLERDLASKK